MQIVCRPASDSHANAFCLERTLDQLSIARIVFQGKNPQWLAHAHFLTVPGGAALMIAQKTPSSLIALTNSWKSTGLTT